MLVDEVGDAGARNPDGVVLVPPARRDLAVERAPFVFVDADPELGAARTVRDADVFDRQPAGGDFLGEAFAGGLRQQGFASTATTEKPLDR